MTQSFKDLMNPSSSPAPTGAELHRRLSAVNPATYGRAACEGHAAAIRAILGDVPPNVEI